jgi:hypothetical protein|tara:strand:- start:1719 stop:2339 length:621 start_codon:yes stop_codon:yes gene_type:complete
MSQQLGKVEKPSASKFRTGRKLFFVPLIFTPLQPDPALSELIDRYWDQVQGQVKNMEEKLSQVKKVYYELIPIGGKKGLKAIEALSKGSHRIVKNILDKGAKLQSIENGDLLAEFMDWSKCLSVGLQSRAVIDKVYQSYIEVQKRRTDQIAEKIDRTLKSEETGVLVMREGHQVQFSSDIQVFYVAPPSLDEIKRWLRARQTEPQV